MGISQFAGGRYITCFSHNEHESIPFWAYYGGPVKEKKVQLKFENFAENFQDCIYTDYAWLDNRTKKIFFYSEEYKETIKSNTIVAQMTGSKPINEDYDIRNCIREVDVFDVNYIPHDAESLTQDFSGVTNVSFGGEEGKSSMQMTAYQPDILGREKTNPWDYECETRIMCVLDHQETSFGDCIDLRLKDEMFRGLTIIMNPWANEAFEEEIKCIVNKSVLPQEIKDSILIERSVIDGTVEL